MKFPFVARTTLDTATAYGDLLLRLAEERETRQNARYDALLQQFTALAAKQTPEPAKLPDRTRDDVIEAILAKARNGQERQSISVWAMKQRRDGVPDATIIEQVTFWPSDDEAGVP